jgi:hypothetical protein
MRYMIKKVVHLWYRADEKATPLRVDCGGFVGWETPLFDRYLTQKRDALNKSGERYYIGNEKGDLTIL